MLATWRCTPTNPSTRKIVCVSCIPSGAPPTSDVGASQDGLFMTNDGRAFFTTNDALVHGDTNERAGCLRVRRRSPAADHSGHR